VLEFRGEDAFTMGIGDLLHLQSPFKGKGIGDPITQAVHVIPVVYLRDQRKHLSFRCFNCLSHQIWQLVEIQISLFTQFVSQVKESDHLVGKGFGRRNADLIAADQWQPGCCFSC